MDKQDRTALPGPNIRRWANAGYWLLENLAGRGLGFLRSVLAARFLSVEAASLGFLAISLGAAARAALESGTTQILVTADETTDELVAASWKLERLKGLLLTGALAAAALAVYFLGRWNIPPATLAVAALVPCSMAFLNPSVRLWERSGNHRRVALITSAGSVGGVLTLLGLLLAGASWWAIPASFAAGHCITALSSHALGARVPDRRVRPAALYALFRRGFPFLLIGLASYFATLGVDLFLALFGALEWVGPYRISVALVHTVLSALPAVAARASLSADAALRRAGGSGATVGADLTTVAVVSSATVLLAALSSVTLPWLAVRIYGEAWLQTAVIIPSLCVFIGVKSLSSPLSAALLANQRFSVVARVHLAEGILCATAIGALARTDIRDGIWAAAAIACVGLLGRVALLLDSGSNSTAKNSAAAVVSLVACAGVAVPVVLARAVGAGEHLIVLGTGSLIALAILVGSFALARRAA